MDNFRSRSIYGSNSIFHICLQSGWLTRESTSAETLGSRCASNQGYRLWMFFLIKSTYLRRSAFFKNWKGTSCRGILQSSQYLRRLSEFQRIFLIVLLLTLFHLLQQIAFASVNLINHQTPQI